MRILIVTTFFPPQNSIASLRPHSWAKHWSLEGHDVTVLTTRKEKEVQELPFDRSGFRLLEVGMPEWLKNLKKTYSPPLATRENAGQQPNFLKRAALNLYHWLRFKKGIFNATRLPDWTHLWVNPALKAVSDQLPWDLVISTAGPYPVHIVAQKIKQSGKAKLWIADYRDKWSDSLIYPGLFPFNAIERILENRLLKDVDMLTTVSEPLSQGYRKRCPKMKVVTIENGFDPDDLLLLDPTPIFPKDGKKRILYTGTIYLGKQNPAPLFRAIAELAQAELTNNLEVLFIGLHHANLAELIDRYQVGSIVKILGFCSRNDSMRMQRDADLLLFLPWNDSNVAGVMTGKVYEYLFSKTPVISVGCSHKEEAQQLIEDARCGISLPDVESIKEYLTHFLRQETANKVTPNPELLERYSRKQLALKLLSSASS